MDEYLKLKAAADKATAAWLENDSAANLYSMKQADAELNAARAAGLNIVKIAPAILEGMMDRSIFGDADRARAARRAS